MGHLRCIESLAIGGTPEATVCLRSALTSRAHQYESLTDPLAENLTARLGASMARGGPRPRYSRPKLSHLVSLSSLPSCWYSDVPFLRYDLSEACEKGVHLISVELHAVEKGTETDSPPCHCSGLNRLLLMFATACEF